jgi:hypothetical protein
MRPLLFPLLFLTAVSCGGKSSSSHTQSCTLNGQPVDCSVLTQRQSERNAQRQETKLRAAITTSVSLTPTTFTTLENKDDTRREVSDGTSFECRVFSYADQSFSYRVSLNTLTISAQGNSERYQRQGSGSGLEGRWQSSTTDAEGTFISVLIFHGNQLQIIQECRFK